MNRRGEGRRTSLLMFALVAVPAALLVSVAPAAGEEDCEHWTSGGAPDPDPFYLPTPDTDPFYAQPDPMPCVSPGTILESRPITFTPIRGAAMPQHEAWQLRFLSIDRFGGPVAAVATVVKPLDTGSDDSPRLLAYQFPENSLGMACAPSHTVGGESQSPVSEIISPLYLPALIAEGWTLVIPDHEGPVAAYAAPVGGAHITLDAVRAAEAFAPLGLPGVATPVAIWGFSGGSTPGTWGAVLQEGYAPELNVVGVVTGGSVVDPASFMREAEGNELFFRFAFIGAIGISRVHPGFFPATFLNDRGRAAVEAVRDGCDGGATDGSPPPQGHFADYTTGDPFATPESEAIAAEVRLPQPGLTPAADTYVYHSVADELIPVESIDALVQGWCDDGATVVYDRIPAGDHVSSFFTGWPGAMDFLRSRLDGTEFHPPPTAQTCN